MAAEHITDDNFDTAIERDLPVLEDPNVYGYFREEGGGMMVVDQTMKRNINSVIAAGKDGIPTPRGTVVGGHADSAGVMPKSGPQNLRERQPRMAADDGVGIKAVQNNGLGHIGG